MSTLRIEKYVDGICVEDMNLPLAPLQFLAGLLPPQARRDLRRQGLDVDALLSDAAAAAPVQWLDVEEGRVAKRIRFSLHD